MLEFISDKNNYLINDRIIDIAKQRLLTNSGQCGVSVTINN